MHDFYAFLSFFLVLVRHKCKQNLLNYKQLVFNSRPELDPFNRWVVLSRLIPWDELCNSYLRQNVVRGAGRKPVNPRIVLGSLIIKYTLNRWTGKL
jgi:hypothetical protein